MHHRPSSPPFSARVRGVLSRGSRFLRAALRRTAAVRFGRLAFGAVVTTTVVVLVLAIPVISGPGWLDVHLDSSSTSAPSREQDDSVFVLEPDGGPDTSAAAPTTSAPSRSDRTAAPSGTTSPATDSPEPAGAPTADGTTAPDTVPTDSPSSTTAPGTTTRPRPADDATEQEADAEDDDAPAAGAPAEAGDRVAKVLALVNEERAEVGCDALVADDGLAATAAAHSAAMSASGVLGLDALDAVGLGGTAAVAQGPGNAHSVVEEWLSDPADGAAFLDCSRTAAGIAVVDGPDGPWWTTLLT